MFFAAIAAALATLIVLAVLRPETPHRGILRFATTRGDRFFVSLLAAAFIFLGFIRFGPRVRRAAHRDDARRPALSWRS